VSSRSVQDEEKYKNYRRLYNRCRNEAELLYYKEIFDTRINSIKQLWNNLNSFAFLGKKKDKNNISKLVVDNNVITDTKSMSNAFNTYFCTVGGKLQSNIKGSDNHLFKTYMPAPVKESMFCSPLTCTEIFQIIAKFKNNKSPGPDNIGPRLLKEVANEIIDPLLYLFNLSLSTGTVPNSLKIAKVIPVYKKGMRSLIQNYRPISLLSIFDKILEKNNVFTVV